jgi:peptidoglycan hydrolase-like protein with peptidoglycan-binding domain
LARAASSTPILARAGAGVAGPCADVEQRPHPALLLKGSTHSAVREAQRKLNLHKTGDSNTPLVPDCMFGPLTDAAVREFQNEQFGGDPKEVDGKIGAKTWAKLDAIVPGPVPPVPPLPPVPPVPPAPLAVTVPDHIRGSASPASMKDRIPPRKDTTVQVDITGLKAGDPPVTLKVEGTGGGHGTVTIDGANTKSMKASGTVKLRGATQTDVGKGGALKLVARQGATQVATSSGFSVSSIPENYSDTFVRLLTGNRRGFVVQDGWKSDSGTFADLNKTEISERVEETKATGCFVGLGSQNSDYLPGNALTKDTHSSATSTLTSTGERIAQQTCMFKDNRSGSVDIPMTNSGYELIREVTARPKGGFDFHITKKGKQTTAKGISANAGTGSIDKTQKV